jgi:hypothetical protein
VPYASCASRRCPVHGIRGQSSSSLPLEHMQAPSAVGPRKIHSQFSVVHKLSSNAGDGQPGARNDSPMGGTALSIPEFSSCCGGRIATNPHRVRRGSDDYGEGLTRDLEFLIRWDDEHGDARVIR